MSEKWLDQPTGIRKGEELDLQKLEAYLQANLEGGSGKLTVDQFPGGASNLTYMIRLGEQELVLRRPPFGSKVKSAHDMGREYKVLSNLSKSYSKAPTPLLYTEDEAIMGAPFYVMERVNGVILRTPDEKDKNIPPDLAYGIAEGLIDTLVEFHALDYEAVGLGELGKPEGYTTRQVTGWSKRYAKSQTDDFPDAAKVIKWLNEHIPGETDSSLVHNDYKHDNVVLDPNDLTKVIAILDWEMCTLGDPLMDLGGTMAYWYNPGDPDFFRRTPAALPGNPTREEFIQLYSQKSGRDVGNFVFYFAFGLFKLAVIIQQIYYRYKMGLTQDPRFKHMNFFVEGLCQMAARAIEKKRIDNLY